MPRQAEARGAVVVIPAWNAAETIGAQLAALATQDFAGDWRVVVVDDGSTDDTSSVVEQSAASFPVELTLVRHDSCRGASAARNTGVLASTEPLILLCDADDVVAPGWITALVAALADADGAGGRLELERLNLEHHRQWALGAEGLTRRWLPFHEELSKRVDLIAPEHPGYGGTPFPDWLDGFPDLVLHYAEFFDRLGLGKVQGRVKLLLDIDRVLAPEESEALPGIVDVVDAAE